jgi:hypothetical protein
MIEGMPLTRVRRAVSFSALAFCVSLPFSIAKAQAADAQVAAEATPPSPPAAASANVAKSSPSLVVPAVLVGTGVAIALVGGIVAATAPKNPPTCDEPTKTCVQQPGESAEDFTNDQNRAGRAHTQPLAGFLTLGVGGIFIVAGLLTYAFGGKGKADRTGANVVPYASRDGGGLAASLSF